MNAVLSSKCGLETGAMAIQMMAGSTRTRRFLSRGDDSLQFVLEAVKEVAEEYGYDFYAEVEDGEITISLNRI